MKFEIKNRWSGEVQFTAEIECSEDTPLKIKVGLAIKAAVKARADLTGAVLTGAVLRGADLTDADLTDADLTGADLRGADLTDADLTDADLTGADLTGADLTDADLTRAVLTDADLTGADLTGADLTDADLTRAVLTRAVLRGAVLRGAVLRGAERHFKADMWMTLSQNRSEVPGLIQALRDGRVDGSQYQGECACLVGTLANVKSVDYTTLDHSARNPAERWFMMIRKGDKPGDETGGGFAASKALDWALEWCALNGIEVDAPVVGPQP